MFNKQNIAKLKAHYKGQAEIVAHTQDHLLLLTSEDGQTFTAEIFAATKHTGGSVGYIGNNLLEMNRRDTDNETFKLAALAAFAAFK